MSSPVYMVMYMHIEYGNMCTETCQILWAVGLRDWGLLPKCFHLELANYCGYQILGKSYQCDREPPRDHLFATAVITAVA